jgi:hypothetical protein
VSSSAFVVVVVVVVVAGDNSRGMSKSTCVTSGSDASDGKQPRYERSGWREGGGAAALSGRIGFEADQSPSFRA